MLKVTILKNYIILLALWLASIVISDLYNSTDLHFMILGLAKPILMFMSLCVTFFLTKINSSAPFYMFFGLFISGIGNFIVPTDYRAVDSLDSESYAYYAFTVTPLVYGIVSLGGYFFYGISRKLAGLLMIAVGIFFAGFVSRTTSALCLLSGIITFFDLSKFILNRKFKRVAISKMLAPGSLVMVVIMSFMLYQLYAFAALNGYMGENQKNKYLLQTTSTYGDSMIGILLAGRPYTLSNYYMIIDYPIFGAGSWPVQGEYIIEAFNNLGATVSGEQFKEVINERGGGHSILLGNWASYGFLAIPIWIYIFYISYYLLICVSLMNNPIKPLLMMYILSFLFGILFNNFNSSARIFATLFPIIYVFYFSNGINQIKPFGAPRKTPVMRK